MYNPLTSSHYACPPHFTHPVVRLKLFQFSSIDTVCLVQKITVHALILITVNKDLL